MSYLALTGGGHNVRVQSSLVPGFNRALVFAGFGIDQISITGHTFTADSDVFDAIDLPNVGTFLALDAAAVRARIERLPWVETAQLSREFPSRLDVRITERTPFALWQRGEREFLIDRTGRVLSAVKPDSELTLPRVEGEGADVQAFALLTLLSRFPSISRRLERAERVAGRRWTLHLSGDMILVLPADSETLALEDIAARGELQALVNGTHRIIDLRATGRITARPSAQAARIAGGTRGS
ncbi:MAG: FtsQ-type POTRA domain-containing protein [Micropepsaceae bacterium]